jgi:hypothetical protein
VLVAATIRAFKFANNTCWRDEDLWGFLRPIAEAELERHRWQGLSITFQPRRGQRRVRWRSETAWCGTSGTAWWCGHRVAINVPTRFEELNEREKIDLASTIAHELWHINTRRGGKAVEIALRKSVKYGRPKTVEGQASQAEYYAWAAKLPLRKAGAVEAVKPDAVPALACAATVAAPRRSLVEARSEKAERDLARWEAELVRREKAVRRAKRKIAAARRKVAYYSKKTAVS